MLFLGGGGYERHGKLEGFFARAVMGGMGVNGLSFQNSMTFNDFFHDLSEFSMTKVKQLF